MSDHDLCQHCGQTYDELMAEARAAERQRIREDVFSHPERLIGHRRHGEQAMSWRQRALHAALREDTATDD